MTDTHKHGDAGPGWTNASSEWVPQCPKCGQSVFRIIATLEADKRILEARLEAAKRAVTDAYCSGRAEVERAQTKYGYDSLRFADTRHGWLCTVTALRDVVPLSTMAAEYERLTRPATAAEQEIDELPGDYGSSYPEPECWGENSYEHYKGECRHQAAEQEAGE